MARWRSLRCSPGAAVFVESDETTRIGNHSALVSFRRLLLQIGGANIAGRGSRFEAAELVVVRGRKACPSLLLGTAPRDPMFNCSARLRSLRADRWRLQILVSESASFSPSQALIALEPEPFDACASRRPLRALAERFF
jgi:hypothetical protein